MVYRDEGHILRDMSPLNNGYRLVLSGMIKNSLLSWVMVACCGVPSALAEYRRGVYSELSPALVLGQPAMRSVVADFAPGDRPRVTARIIDQYVPAGATEADVGVTIELVFIHDRRGLFADVLDCLGTEANLVWFEHIRNGTRSRLRFSLETSARYIERIVHSLNQISDGRPNDRQSLDQLSDTYILELTLPNEPGRLAPVAHSLRDLGVSITSFLTPQPEVDTGLMQMVFELAVPPAMTEAELLEVLNAPSRSELTVVSGNLIDVIVERYLLGQLRQSIQEFLPSIRKALGVVAAKHMGQSRKNRITPFIMHQIDIVKILINEFFIPFDVDELMAAILHDAIEDHNISDEHLQKEFGMQVYTIVDFVTRRKTGDKNTDELMYLSRLRQATGLLAVKAQILKLADKLANLRTLNIGSLEFSRRTFFSTYDTFIPLFVARIQHEGIVANDPWAAALQFAIAVFFQEFNRIGQEWGFLDDTGQVVEEQYNQYLQETGRDRLVGIMSAPDMSGTAVLPQQSI